MYANNKGFTLIELLVLIMLMSIGLVFLSKMFLHPLKVKQQNSFSEVKTKSVTITEDKVDCDQFELNYKAADYLNIPAACFDKYHITDAMIEAALKSQERVANPCNN